jgi:hypothetical protein
MRSWYSAVTLLLLLLLLLCLKTSATDPRIRKKALLRSSALGGNEFVDAVISCDRFFFLFFFAE